MYAIIKTGGKQYRVQEGDVIEVERLAGKKGDEVSFDDVLLVGGDDGIKTGDDTAKTAVKASIIEQGKGRKITVFKFKRRKMYRRKRGHRQSYTRLEIGKIG